MAALAYVFAIFLIAAAILGTIIIIVKVFEYFKSSTYKQNQELKAEIASMKEDKEALDKKRQYEIDSLRAVLNSIATGVSASPETEAKLALYDNYRTERPSL